MKAIFVGHLHSRQGRETSLSNNGLWEGDGGTYDDGTKETPIFYCGSAQYNYYLEADFTPEGMMVTVVDSSYGDVVLGEDWYVSFE